MWKVPTNILTLGPKGRLEINVNPSVFLKVCNLQRQLRILFGWLHSFQIVLCALSLSVPYHRAKKKGCVKFDVKQSFKENFVF